MSAPVVFADNDRLILDAAKELLEQTEAREYQRAIWEMFECWVSSELTDGSNCRDRATVWFACKWLNDFFERSKGVPVSKPTI